MSDENSKLLDQFSKIIQQLMLPSNHNLTIKQFLERLELE